MALVAALYPGMSALVGRDTNRLRRLFDDSIWYVTALSAPIVFGLFAIAPDAIALAGDEYAGAVPVLQILIFVLIPIFLDFPVGSLLNAADRQSTKTTIMGLTVLLNVFLNVLLIPRFGIMGAGIAALASFTFLSIGGLYFVPRIIKGYSYVTLGRIISPILLSGLVMGVSAFLLRPIIGFVLTIPVAAVIYIAMLVITRSLRVDQLRVALDLIRRKPSYAENTSIHD
jgi:O-antigen/teichoic acid export membrane protein